MSVQDIIYSFPLEESIQRRDFQDFARDRMSVYKLLDQYKDKFNQQVLERMKKSKKELSKEADNLFQQLLNPWPVKPSLEAKKIDNFSHYICRLIFCSSPENINNFVTCESMIFMSRLMRKEKGQAKEQKIFEELSNLICKESYFTGEIKQVEEIEFQQIKQKLYASCKQYHRFPEGATSRKYEDWKPASLYKVPMEFCESLISTRKCFLHQGFAYLQGELLIKVLPKMYSKYLRLAMEDLEKRAKDILANDPDNQFREFIRQSPSTLFSQPVSLEDLKEPLSLKNIVALSKRSFPPCMIQMYDTLVTKKHLKHQARLQLMMFLKVAGLSLKDSETLWKQNYTKGVSDSQSKEIQYAVRHSYGKEGKKVDYNAKDCSKIINSKPTTDEYHGCPFKYYGDSQLVKFLRSKYPTVSPSFLEQVLQNKSNNQFEVACRGLFQVTHANPKADTFSFSKGVGRHPNSYFLQSEKYFESYQN